MEKCLSFHTLDVIKLSERHKSDLYLEDGICLLLHGHISKHLISFWLLDFHYSPSLEKLRDMKIVFHVSYRL